MDATPRSDFRSGDPPAETGRQDGQLLAIFCHGPAGNVETALVEKFRDALVGQWFLLVLLVDERLDDVLGGARRDVLAIVRLEPAREEELQLEDAAGRLHVL